MKSLTPDEMRELRADIVCLNLPDDKADEMIRLLDNIITSIIDQNSGRHSIQLSLSARANYAFRKNENDDDYLVKQERSSVDIDEIYAITENKVRIKFDPG